VPMSSSDGAYRRRIRLTAPHPGRVVAEMEDDFHHFGVELDHDGERVTGVRGSAERFPWTTCPSAAGELQALVGAPLATRSPAIAEQVPARQNCTHMYDLAGLALAQAGTGRPNRQYDVTVPDRVNWTTEATLDRDAEPVLRWRVHGRRIEGPSPFAGQPLEGSFLAWAEATLDPDTVEAAIVLRRALVISMGRVMDLDVFAVATELGSRVAGTCYSFQPERMPVAMRMTGSTRDFSESPDSLLG